MMRGAAHADERTDRPAAQCYCGRESACFAIVGDRANDADRRRFESGRRDLEAEESELSALLSAALEAR